MCCGFSKFEHTDTLLVHDWKGQSCSSPLCQLLFVQLPALTAPFLLQGLTSQAIHCHEEASCRNPEGASREVTRGHTTAMNYCHQQKEHAGARCYMRRVSHSPKLTSHHRLRYSCSTGTHQPQPLFSSDSLEPYDNIF